MKSKTILGIVLVFLLATVAAAQTKISGTANCGQPEKQNSIEVGDRPGHLFMISQGKCTYANFTEIAGIGSKEYVFTGFDEVSGGNARSQGFVVTTMANGDMSYVRYQGTTSYKDGQLQSGGGKWTFVGGTGKVKGVKGKGTYKVQSGPQGLTNDIEGEYELPK